MNIEHLLTTWAERLRREEPKAVAILCHGSYARGAAEAHSDLDLDVLVDGGAQTGYRSAFEELPDGRLLHITISTETLESWLEQFADAEAEHWSFFLPARQQTRLLWAAPEAHERLAGHITLELQVTPQLQDLLENAAKVRNASARGDELGVRLAAHDLAGCCPALLALLNTPVTVDTRRMALQAALELEQVPEGYRENMLTCLGMSGRATTPQEVHDAALRLALSAVAALQARPDVAAGHIEAGLPAALADGRLYRLLTQA